MAPRKNKTKIWYQNLKKYITGSLSQKCISTMSYTDLISNLFMTKMKLLKVKMWYKNEVSCQDVIISSALDELSDLAAEGWSPLGAEQ